MGTEGSIGFISKGIKKSYMVDCDAHPTRTGYSIVTFCTYLNNTNGWDTFKKSVDNLKDVDPEGFLDKDIDFIEKNKDYIYRVNKEKGLLRRVVIYREFFLGRSTNTDPLFDILKGDLNIISNEDACMPYWSYIFNFDTNNLEVYHVSWHDKEYTLLKEYPFKYLQIKDNYNTLYQDFYGFECISENEILTIRRKNKIEKII